MKSNKVISAEMLAYYQRISTETFTVVDLETTGGMGSRDRIIEISVLQATLKSGIQKISTHLINPRIQIPRKIVEYTGITQDMVAPAESSDQILPNYLPMLQTGILTAHNFSFDYSFLQAEYRRLGIDFRAPKQLCTVKLSRLLLADLPSRSLPNLVKHFGFNVGKSHRAESDAIACWLLLEKLLQQIHKSHLAAY
jgi:DNA polymerase III subunit epsilon